MANRQKKCEADDLNLELVLDQLKCQFAEMVPARRMRWQNHIPDGIDITEALQKRVLNATMNNPVSVKYPPSLSYRRSFMKQFIHMLEKSGCDVCDEVYEIYTAILQQMDDFVCGYCDVFDEMTQLEKSGCDVCDEVYEIYTGILQQVEEEDDTLCYKTYYLPNETVSLQESVNLISRGTTGLSTWQAAQHLAEWCLENRDVFHNKKVLELGSGLGLSGITVCRECNPESYHFTDSHSQVLFLLAKNIERNLSNRPKGGTGDNSPTCVKDATMIKRIRRQLSLNAESMAKELGCLVTSSNGDEISDANSDSGDFELSNTYWGKDGGSPDASFLKSDSRVRILRLNWEHVSSSMVSRIKPHIILAADVVYDIQVIPFLVSALAKIMKLSKCVAYIACTVRNDETRDQFLYALGTVDLKFEQISGPVKELFHYDRSIPIEITKVYL